MFGLFGKKSSNPVPASTGGRRTKIVATIGPVSDSPDIIRELLAAGVDIFRFNMKHATRDWHDERIARVREIALNAKKKIGILIDLQGPEIRLETVEKKDIPFKAGEMVTFRLVAKDSRDIMIPTKEFFAAMKPEVRVLIDDGAAEIIVNNELGPDWFTGKISIDYTMKHRKSLNVRGIELPLPSLIDDDLLKLDMKNIGMVDFVALSFTRTKQDVEILRDEMKKRNINAWITAKIENQTALDNLDEIIDAAESIMVARGDLGVETPIEQLAFHQKQIITKCREKNKPVITATQMLHSMVENLRPTRAEACDVSNAVYDGTDATMLSEESAGGKYPVEAVKMMEKILEFTETVAAIPKANNRFNEKLR